MGLFDWITGNRAPDPAAPRRTAPELTAALLALNRDDIPWQVRRGGSGEPDLVVEWKIVDARWYDLFGKAGLSKTFRVLMRLDEASGTVRSVDQDVEVTWHAGVPTASFKASAFRGQEVSFERGIAWGVKEDGSLGQTYNYRFSTNDIKKPLRQAVADNGWGWHGVAFTRL